LTLRCPFCGAEEDERVEGVDESGNEVTLLMFHCPFFFKLSRDFAGEDNTIQDFLNHWRLENGNEWLESLGPVMKNRELKNMQKSGKISSV